MTQTARRLEHLFESTIRGLTVYATGKGAINLGQGSPDFGPPEALLEAAKEALSSGYNQYAPTWGLKELREAIAQKTRRFYGLDFDPELEITVTCGVTEAVISALLGTVNPGEKVIILEPAHENYYAGAVFAGAESIFVPLYPPHFGFDESELRAAFSRSGVKAIILNTPHNPTGRVFSAGELGLIAELCLEHGVIAISDEIYEHMVFEGRHLPIASFEGMRDRSITISGMSKSYSVTGWRVGYALASPELTGALRKVHDFTTICAPTPLQRASITALDFGPDYYRWLHDYYLERRERMLRILSEAGFDAPVPEGAYYTLADFRPVAKALGVGDDDHAFSYWLIDEIGIGAIPASSFYHSDPGLGRGRLRFAFPKKDETLDVVEERLGKLRRRAR